MNVAQAYLVGVLTLPALFVVAWLIAASMERGKEIECRACGYSTGPMRKTRRVVCWVRWQSHKLATGHHTRRWLRAQKRAGSTR